MTKVSIIITTYNAARSIDKCISSILNQSYQNLELIIIDNGSTDKTLQLCENYAKADKRIKLISQGHTNMNNIRNTALALVTGEYILFVDSEDYLLTDAVQKSLKLAKSTSSDIVIFEWYEKTANGLATVPVPFKIRNSSTALVGDILNDRQPAHIWNKLYLASLWKDTKFTINKKETTDDTIKKIFIKAINLFYLPEALYVHNTPSKVDGFSQDCFTSAKNNTSPLKLLSRLGLLYCGIQLALRFVLFFLSAQDISWKLLDILRALSLGFTFDITIVLCLLAPLSILLSTASSSFLRSRLGKMLTYCLTASFFATVTFSTICEYYFWEEFHTRFNFIAVDYLVYTHELINNIKQSYPVMPLLLLVLGASLLASYFFLKNNKQIILLQGLGNRLRFISTHILAAVLCLAVMRSSFTTYVATNNYNQEISGNGIFQLFHAFFNNELDYERFYLHKDNQFILAQLQQKLSLDGSILNNSYNSSRSTHSLNPSMEKKPNIVVIAVESLSASFTGLVNKEHSYTPFLDELARSSFTYDRVYATGTRTVRGLEALSLSLPPTPGQSILRRPDSSDLFNLSTPLEKLGYKAEFVYGGYGYFDNMNEFFSSNSFSIFDRTDIPKEEVSFETVWGVADETLFDQALKRLDEKTSDSPTLQLILTTTNHRPYTFPKDSIEAPQGKRESVVKYTDWAIHRFLQKAAARPWFDNTVFVIVADHNASVAGKTTLPVHKYHIPCLVYAPKLIKPGHSSRLMSQIDVIPTVFGMLGLSYESQNLGYDINKLPPTKERIFISTYQQLGYISNDTLVVLEPNNKVSAYKIDDYATSSYSKIQPTPELVNDAVTWYQGASYLYKNKLLKQNSQLVQHQNNDSNHS